MKTLTLIIALMVSGACMAEDENRIVADSTNMAWSAGLLYSAVIGSRTNHLPSVFS